MNPEPAQPNPTATQPRATQSSPDPRPESPDRDQNLTAAQLAERREDASPMPNHSLVICKRERTGYVVSRVIPPNKTFRFYMKSRRLLFFAYAVPHGRKWVTFKQSYPVPGSGPSIELNFTLMYEVEDHAKLVELLRDDPLRIVQRQVETGFGQVARQLTWANPTREGLTLESFSLPCPELHHMDDRATYAAPFFADLQGFARDYGLRIIGLSISRGLSPQDSAFLHEMERLRQAEQLQNLQHRITLNESVFQELLQKLRVLINQININDYGGTEILEKLREFTSLLQGLVALSPAEQSQLGRAASSTATNPSDRRTA